MTQFAPIELDDGRIIYIEATEGTEPPEVTRGTGQQPITKGGTRTTLVQQFEVIRDTISAYTTYTLDAFKEVASANVNKVTLEFGIKVAGEAGIPYVTKGTAESNLKITVECTFPDQRSEKDRVAKTETPETISTAAGSGQS
jgi:hypothetical protein